MQCFAEDSQQRKEDVCTILGVFNVRFQIYIIIKCQLSPKLNIYNFNFKYSGKEDSIFILFIFLPFLAIFFTDPNSLVVLAHFFQTGFEGWVTSPARTLEVTLSTTSTVCKQSCCTAKFGAKFNNVLFWDCYYLSVSHGARV